MGKLISRLLLNTDGEEVQRYWIPEINYDAFTTRLEKYSESVEKAGFIPLGIEVIKTDIIPKQVLKDNKYITVLMEHSLLSVKGYLPYVQNKYELIAILERIHNNNHILFESPKYYKNAMELRNRDNSCDHCKVTRNRKKIYVFKNTQGEFLQVGATCIDAFFGKSELKYLTKYAKDYTKALEGILLEKDVPVEYNTNYVYYNTDILTKIILHSYLYNKSLMSDDIIYRYEQYTETEYDLKINMMEHRIMVECILSYDTYDSYLIQLVSLLSDTYVRKQDIKVLVDFPTVSQQLGGYTLNYYNDLATKLKPHKTKTT